MNPAVTIGVLAAGAIGVGEAVGYIISQLIGGVAGALLLRTVLGGIATGLGTPALAHGLVLGATTVTITPEAGFVIEALLAFFLVTVVLSTAVAGRAGNLAPLAIGMTLTLNIIMGGALTGAPSTPGQSHMAKNSENPNESSKIVRRLIPLCSRSDSVARCFRKPYAIALPSTRRERSVQWSQPAISATPGCT
jgi:hypothetical protein